MNPFRPRLRPRLLLVALVAVAPAIAAIAVTQSGLYIGMGIDHDAAFREFDRIHRTYLWLLGIVSLAGVGAAVMGGHLFVLRPVKALKAVTDRIAAGDLSARAQPASSVAGASELGDAVNAMASALDTREHERAIAERELRDSEDRYRLLFGQNPHPMWVYDAATLDFLEVNDAAVQHYGYSRSEFLAMRVTDIRPADDVMRLTATLESARGPLMPLGDCRHRLKSGQIIDAAITSHMLVFAGRPAVGVTAQDITVRTRSEAALAERAALSTVSAEVGVAINRPGELSVGLQSCAEAIVAHMDLAVVKIWVINPTTDLLELEATAGAGDHDDVRDGLKAGELTVGRIAQERRRYVTNDLIGDTAVYDRDWALREGMVAFGGWPLVDGDRVVGVMALFARDRLSEGAIGGLTWVSALIALGVSRHQSEDARRLLAAIVASSDDAILGATPDGTIVSWNASAKKLFGYAEEEIVGRPVSLLVPPDRGAELQDLLARMNRGEHVTHRETVRQRKDGSLVPVSLTLSPIKGAAGDVTGMSAIMRDMTERRRAEERLHLLVRALESTNEMVSVTDANDRITFVNAAFLRAYGYAAEEVIGQTPALVQSNQTPDTLVQEILRESRRNGWKGELLNRRRDGTEFFISLNTSAVRDDRGEIVGLLAVARDITERRSLEDQLRQSQKMDAVGQLAGGIAHDFNNLLTAILGFAGFLAEGLPEPDERHADVKEIQHAAQRAASLTRQLLAFSRKQILAVRVLHIGDIVSDLTPMLRRLLGESIDLRTTVGDRGLAKTDPGQLQQVILNLAVNSRDAMPHGGRLTLETSDVVLDDTFARLHPSVRPGPHVMLAVSDTGYGMDAATQKRIFEPFFTTKPMGKGTGLGLATVYGIVKQSGGTIWVHSELGRGTTFTVYLPRTDDIEEEADRPAPIDTRALGGAETVLLVEDEDQMREFVYKVLSRRGYTVHAVADPVKALEYAQAHRATIALVISDVILPNMNGQTMVTKMQHGHPESKVLYMSGYADQAIVHQGVLDAGTAFLQKPFTADALARKVRDVLDA